MITKTPVMIKRQESRVRRLADREGYRVEKSRQQEHLNNQGEYMLVENSRNLVVLGEKYDATLEEIEEWLKGDRGTR